MDVNSPAPSVLGTLRTVEFRLGLKGYNVDEVDEYLEKAALEAETLQDQFRTLQDRLRQANERIMALERGGRPATVSAAPPPTAASSAPPPLAEPATDDTLTRTLLMAQRFVDQAKKESEAEARALVAQAEEKAKATIAGAEEKARQLATESEGRLRDEVGRLESVRSNLARDVENMARHLEAERARLKGALAEMLEWIDDNVQPGASLMAQPKEPTPPSVTRPTTPAPTAELRGFDAANGHPNRD